MRSCFFFKQKTAYEMRISDWSSDVCSSALVDEWLRGKPGAEKVIRDRRGRIVENVDLVRAAEQGKYLTLSIDRRIQYLTYRELKRALLESGADSASAVVLDVHTGEVLAMANLPSYN